MAAAAWPTPFSVAQKVCLPDVCYMHKCVLCYCVQSKKNIYQHVKMAIAPFLPFRSAVDHRSIFTLFKLHVLG